MTPLQLELDDAHKARLARFNAAIFRAQHPIPIPRPPPTPPPPLPDPPPLPEPQRDVLHVSSPPEPIPPTLQKQKRCWFHISSELSYPKIAAIQHIVAERFDVTVVDLISPRRTANVVRPRQIAIYLAKRLTPKSLPEIGRRFGDRDHTTILHATRRIEELCKSDEYLSRAVDELETLLNPQRLLSDQVETKPAE